MARCYIGKRHASNAPASLSFNISRFVTPAVPPTGADANGLSWSVRTVPRAGWRHQPNRKTKSRRSGVGNLFICRRVQRHGFAFACKHFASRRGLLVCRGGVRTFAAAVMWSNDAGLLYRHSGRRAGLHGDARASPSPSCHAGSLAVMLHCHALRFFVNANLIMLSNFHLLRSGFLPEKRPSIEASIGESWTAGLRSA